MSLVEIHARLATTTLLYVIVLGLWGLWRVIKKESLSGSYWGALVIAEILILIQGSLGALLWFLALRPEHGGMHVLYGIVGALGIPAVYAFTRGGNSQREMILYTAIMAFNIGIFLRAVATGG